MSQPAVTPAPNSELCARAGVDWAVDPSRMLLDYSRARRAAVLVLFGVLDSLPAKPSTAPITGPALTGPVARDLDVLLQRRAATMGHHPGQISFPGGGADASDPDLAATALREAVEETGLNRAESKSWGCCPNCRYR